MFFEDNREQGATTACNTVRVYNMWVAFGLKLWLAVKVPFHRVYDAYFKAFSAFCSSV